MHVKFLIWGAYVQDSQMSFENMSVKHQKVYALSTEHVNFSSMTKR